MSLSAPIDLQQGEYNCISVAIGNVDLIVLFLDLSTGHLLISFKIILFLKSELVQSQMMNTALLYTTPDTCISY